jgi:hypothetical protein
MAIKICTSIAFVKAIPWQIYYLYFRKLAAPVLLFVERRKGNDRILKRAGFLPASSNTKPAAAAVNPGGL